MSSIRMKVAGIAVTIFFATATSPAGAVDLGSKLAFHGYGNWAYAKTDNNTYVGGTSQGTWDQMEFSLGLAAEPVENLTIHAQAFWEMREGGSEASLDFAFVEYSFSPAIAVRAGRVKQPFGIYTEIFDVGVLAPFNHLPQGIYGPAGFISEGYMGGGVTGALGISSNLRLQYDLYGGELESALTTPWAESAAPSEGAEPSADVQNMVGGRVQVGPPDGTFTFGASAYSGKLDRESSGESEHLKRHGAVGAHAEVMLRAFTLRAEFAHQTGASYTANAAYAEGSYLITPHWRVALRYDWTKTDPDGTDEVDSSLLESKDLGVGLSYVMNANVVVKLAYHAVDGNRFTTANEGEETDTKTNLFTAGVSFSF